MNERKFLKEKRDGQKFYTKLIQDASKELYSISVKFLTEDLIKEFENYGGTLEGFEEHTITLIFSSMYGNFINKVEKAYDESVTQLFIKEDCPPSLSIVFAVESGFSYVMNGVEAQKQVYAIYPNQAELFLKQHVNNYLNYLAQKASSEKAAKPTMSEKNDGLTKIH